MPTEVSTAIVKLNGREDVAEGTMAYHFDKPNRFEFRAGQAIDITLLNPPETDSEGNIRTFSIASPPVEDRLTVTTRMRDTAFKRVLKSMPLRRSCSTSRHRTNGSLAVREAALEVSGTRNRRLNVDLGGESVS